MKTVFAKTTELLSIVGKLDSDKMKLFIDAERVGTGTVTRDDIHQILKEFISLDEVNEGVIDDIAHLLSKGEKVTERRIVKGVPPETGMDGKLLLLVKRFTGGGEPRRDSQAGTSYFDLDLFDNIIVGQTVARIYPPKAGIDGKDALGVKLVAKPGKPIKVSVDKTLTVQPAGSEPYETVVSNAEGYLMEENGRLLVRDELGVQGDVDFHLGNIDFIGKVVVSGDVLPGFNIRAKKGIEVRGAVRGGGQLISSEGDISVKGFAYGGEKSKIIAGGSLFLSVAQEVNAEVIGDIIVQKEANSCRFRSEGSIISPNARIFGGVSYVVCGIEAKELGIEVGGATDFVLCSDIETKTEYSTLLHSIETHDRARNLLELHLGPYAKNASRVQLLKGAQREKIEQLLKKYNEVEASRTKLLTRKKDMLEGARKNEVIRVNFHKLMNPGVKVIASEVVYEAKDPVPGPASLEFKVAEAVFELGPLKPLECKPKTPVEEEKKNGK